MDNQNKKNNNYKNNKNTKNKNKSVTFDNLIYIYHIPSIQDFFIFVKNYKERFWYSSRDYNQFINNHLTEINELINRGANLHDAKRLLYQTNIEYNEENFLSE